MIFGGTTRYWDCTLLKRRVVSQAPTCLIVQRSLNNSDRPEVCVSARRHCGGQVSLCGQLWSCLIGTNVSDIWYVCRRLSEDYHNSATGVWPVSCAGHYQHTPSGDIKKGPHHLPLGICDILFRTLNQHSFHHFHRVSERHRARALVQARAV